MVNDNSTGIKIWLWAVPLVIAINTSVVGYGVSLIHSLDVRTSKLETQLLYQQNLPPWFLDQVKANAQRIQELDSKCSRCRN